MNRETKRGENWLPVLLTTLLLGVGLHGLFDLWPTLLTEFFAPVNESIWEHVKVIFWPLLLAELGCFPPSHRSGGLYAILLCCTGMLLAGWMYHLVFRGSALWVDLMIYGVCILGYFLLSEASWTKQASLPLLWTAILVLMGLIVLFTLAPPHGAMFSDLRLAEAWRSLLQRQV